MVQFQLMTGCRPGEVCKIRPAIVDRSLDSVWEVKLDFHKGTWRGKDRVIYVGPKAQQILAPYLSRDPESFCFTPKESEQQRKAASARKTPLNQGNKVGYSKRVREGRESEREPGDSWSTQSYGKSIKAACRQAKIEPWSPNQLRHLAATLIRRDYGLEAAQVILGHSKADVTQIYAEKNRQLALEVAKQAG